MMVRTMWVYSDIKYIDCDWINPCSAAGKGTAGIVHYKNGPDNILPKQFI